MALYTHVIYSDVEAKLNNFFVWEAAKGVPPLVVRLLRPYLQKKFFFLSGPAFTQPPLNGWTTSG